VLGFLAIYVTHDVVAGREGGGALGGQVEVAEVGA